jgi:hypothetical protein
MDRVRETAGVEALRPRHKSIGTLSFEVVVLLGPELDANYERIAAATYEWPGEKSDHTARIEH